MTIHKARIMRDAVRRLLPVGDVISSKLAAVSHGMAADGIGSIPPAGTIVTVPKFANITYAATPTVNLIIWDAPTAITLADDETRTMKWRIEDSTYDTLEGTITFTPTPDGHAIAGDVPPSVVAPTATPYWTEQEGRRRLAKLSRDGSTNMFELARLLLAFAREAVDSASMRVYREINNGEGGLHVIDEIEREQVIDNLMWGTDGTEGSVVTRELRRCAGTDHTHRKSTVQVIATRIWSAAETYVRQHIGDPHLGRVIRRLARSIGSDDPDTVHEAYRARNPNDRVGIGRITAALTAGSSLHTETVPLATFDSTPDGAERAR